MPDRFAHSAAPPNALPFWSDGLSLWTELPGPNGVPVVLRYPLTQLGLSQALGIIRTRAFDTHDRTAATPPRDTTADRQRAARAVLRKLGISPP